MSDSANNPLFQPPQPKPDPRPGTSSSGSSKKVIEPLHGQSSREETSNPAVEMIRGKIDAIYGGKPDEAKTEPNAKEELIEAEAASGHRSKHQQFMYDLSKSGKSLAEIQTAWHNYYQELPDEEKHEVWQEFYAEHSKADQELKIPRVQSHQGKQKEAGATVHPPQQSAPVTAAPQTKKSGEQEMRSVSEVKQQLIRKVQKRAKPRNPHLQSLIFGVGMGTVVVLIMMFSFFNERIIAPFITPSRTVSSTPIITDLNSTAVGKDPKIIIPKINVEIPVVYDEPSIQEAAVQKALERGVLHYATTPNPGEKGNAVVFGHSSNNILNSGKYKFAFVLLHRLEVGDTFMLEYQGKRYVYKVFTKKVVPPTDLSVLENISGKAATTTLITCDPPGTARNRLIVTGEQISPSPTQNIASTVKKTQTRQPAELPSNSPSLWSRITNWF